MTSHSNQFAQGRGEALLRYWVTSAIIVGALHFLTTCCMSVYVLQYHAYDATYPGKWFLQVLLAPAFLVIQHVNGILVGVIVLLANSSLWGIAVGGAITFLRHLAIRSS